MKATVKIFIGPLEQDASTNKTQVQISAPIISNDETIGVLVMGVSVDYLVGATVIVVAMKKCGDFNLKMNHVTFRTQL